jgi:hypothetical protein
LAGVEGELADLMAGLVRRRRSLGSRILRDCKLLCVIMFWLFSFAFPSMLSVRDFNCKLADVITVKRTNQEIICASIIGFVAIATIPIPFFFSAFGAKIRAKNPYSKQV